MKFSHSLQFNAVPEWSSKYIAYSHLKKLIYSLQKEKLYSGTTASSAASANNSVNLAFRDNEIQPLLSGGSPQQHETTLENYLTTDPYVIRFVEALDTQVKKIDKFFISQETGIKANYNELMDDVKEFEHDLLNNQLPILSDAVPGHSGGARLGHPRTGFVRGGANVSQRASFSSSHRPSTIGSIASGDEERADDYEYYEPFNEDNERESVNSAMQLSIASAPAMQVTELDVLDRNGLLRTITTGYGDDDDEEDEENGDNRAVHKAGTANRLHRGTREGTAATTSELFPSKSTTGYSAVPDLVNSAHDDYKAQNSLITPFLQHKVTLKKRLVAMFTQLSELKDFIELNATGFSKICKKFDKSLDTSIKQPYLRSLAVKSHVFKPETLQEVKHLLAKTVIIYARLSKETYPYIPTKSAAYVDDTSRSVSSSVTNFEELPDKEFVDYKAAKEELSSHLRDHVVWERNTVWKDMMNLERKAQNVRLAPTSMKTPNPLVPGAGSLTGDAEPSLLEFNSLAPQQKSVTLRDFFRLSWRQYLTLFLSSTLLIRFIVFTAIFLFLVFAWSPFDDKLQKNCFAILIYASLLWATETLPLFVTSLMIPMLIVIFPVLKDQNTSQPMSPVQASQYILSTMWGSVIMLLLGGFTLAAALSKYNIAKVLSTYILASVGTNPQVILLANMFVALFVSMWVSNVAAPVLCYSIIQPLLRTLPRQCDYAKALILGIALASNIGGMASPIASPQNIFSIGMMNPPASWGEWFIVSLPVCIISILLIWVLLLLTFKTDSKNIKILEFHPIRDPFTLTQWFVSLVCIVTIILWCLSNRLSSKFGEMGIISIIPMITLFGTGLLSADDFNNFMWTIVVLAMGGTTLGKAVSNSGLLSVIAQIIMENIQGRSLFTIVLLFGLCILVMATFVSHTVAAMILVPLMSEIGAKLPGVDHSRLLIMITALLCSAAMGLPTSGFPNVTAISMIDEVGDRYLTVGIFITRGVPASFIAYSMVISVGYIIMKINGF